MNVEETYRAIKAFQHEIYNATDWDSAQKVYRQCRIWVRIQIAYAQALTVRQGNYINHKVNVARKEVLGKWRKSHQKKQQAQHQTNKRNRDYWRYHYDGSSGRGDRNYYRQESLEKRIAATD